MDYIIIFFLGAVLCSFTKSRRISLFAAFWGIILVSTFCGVRNDDIGVDLTTYVNKVWDFSQRSKSFQELLRYSYFGVEPLYLVFNYLISRFFIDVHWLYFSISFVVILGFVLGIRNLSYRKWAFVGMVVFLFMFFPRSLNIVRQYIALSLIFWGLSYLLVDKIKPFLVLTICAFFMHHSSIIALLLPVLWIYLRKRPSINKIVLIIFVSSVGIAGFSLVINLVSSVFSKYAAYGNNAFDTHFSVFGFANIPLIILMLLFFRQLKSAYKEAPFLLSCLIIGFFLQQLSWVVSGFLQRTGFSFDLTFIPASMLMCEWSKNHIRGGRIVSYAILLYAVAYFVLAFIVAGQSGIYPYRSVLLDNLVFLWF